MAEGLTIGRQGHLRFVGKRIPVRILAVRHDTVAVRVIEGPCPYVGAGVELEHAEGWWVAAYHMRVALRSQDHNDLIVLRRASNLRSSERRQSWRVPVDAPGDARRRGENDWFEVQIVDLSAEGGLIEAKRELAVDDLIDLQVALCGKAGRLLVGRIIREEPSDSIASDYRRYGLWFVEMPAESRRVLTQFVWERLQSIRPEDVAALFPGSDVERVLIRRKRSSGGAPS